MCLEQVSPQGLGVEESPFALGTLDVPECVVFLHFVLVAQCPHRERVSADGASKRVLLVVSLHVDLERLQSRESRVACRACVRLLRCRDEDCVLECK